MQIPSLVHTLLLSIALFQAVFILIQYIIFKRKEYLYYILYILCISTYIYNCLEIQINLTGYSLAYPYLQRLLDVPMLALAFYLYVHFGSRFLDITPARKAYLPVIIFKAFVLTVMVAFAAFVPLGIDMATANVVFMVCSPFMFGVAVWILYVLYNEGGALDYFVIGGGLMIALGGISGIVVAATSRQLGIGNPAVYYPMEIAVLLELLLLNTGLIFKSRLLEKNVIQSQQQLIDEYERNEQLMKKLSGIRQKISSDLHDDIGASLSSLHIYSALAENIFDQKPGKAKELLREISTNTQQVMDRMGDIVWAMQSAADEHLTIEAKIKNYGSSLLAAKNIKCIYNIAPDATLRITNMEARKNILLMIKEALNNVAKYSAADTAEVNLYMDSSNLVVTIKDNGKGFNTGTVILGNGIRNMQHRAQILGGICTILTAPGHGVTLTCLLPIANISDT
ncbi:MAG TPA: histidine kinase [Ferruginibacter sp.]|nr:histidine kinase [Ferruginibacter sp.]HMP19530.1 histidine kinase [Ferruginibacter sp.]